MWHTTFIKQQAVRLCSISKTAVGVVCLSLSLSLLPAHGANSLTREQAIATALQRNGGQGKVLAVRKTENSNGQTVYAVKVLTNGRVKVYHVGP